MYKGFYNNVSGMLTQQRVLNTISNNLTNASTPGYKRDITTSSTFNDVLAYRMGNVDKRNTSYLGGSLSSLRTVDELVTLYEQGAVSTTGRTLDFAIEGDGFFQVQTAEGMVYTRNGAFTLDENGYLALQAGGQVMGVNQTSIFVGTDAFNVAPDGTITGENGGYLGQVRVVDFADYADLEKNAAGFFTTGAAPQPANGTETRVVAGALEESNVNVVQETVNMIEAQRAFQSASQLFRMYDQLNAASDEIGKL